MVLRITLTVPIDVDPQPVYEQAGGIPVEIIGTGYPSEPAVLAEGPTYRTKAGHLQSSLPVTGLAPPEWVLESGVWSDAGIWLEGKSWS